MTIVRLAHSGALLLALASFASAQSPHVITLKDAVALAQARGLQGRAALATRDAARARDRAFDAQFLPSLSLGGLAPTYRRSVTAVTQPDGTIKYLPVEQGTGDLSASINQKLPWTNTILSFSSALSQVQRTGTAYSKTWSSTPYAIGISQPLLRSNSQRWDTRQQGLREEAAERHYLEAKEDVATAATNAFFDAYAATVQLANAAKNATTNDTLYTLNKGRLEVGKIGENDLLQSELALLRARAAEDDAKLGQARALAQLRILLDLPADEPITLEASSATPEFAADTGRAVAEARMRASAMTDADLGEVGADRGVSEARWNTGAGGTLTASYGFNATAATAPDVYKNLLNARQVQLALSMPLWQWGGRTAQVQAARADRDAVRSNAALSRKNAEHGARFAALQLDQARRALTLAAKADTVAQKRFGVAYNRYVIGKINVDNLYLAQNEKDQAVTAYVQALRGFWTAYYGLRKATLFDFETGQAIH